VARSAGSGRRPDAAGPHRGGGEQPLCVHSFLDGVGIGLGFKVSFAVGLIITVGIVTHDFSDGVNTVTLILKHRGTVRQAFGWLALDALAPAIGATSTCFFTLSDADLGQALALFCGFLLYIGASDVLPDSQRHNPTVWSALLTLLGAGTLYVAVRLSRP
jgi:zinc transporter ZupT